MTHLQQQALKRFGINLGQGDIIKIHNLVLAIKTPHRRMLKSNDPVYQVTWDGHWMFVLCDNKTRFPMTVWDYKYEFGGRLSRRL